MVEILWTPAALWALRAMHWRDATRVDGAIQRFAHSGEGTLTRVYADNPRVLRLRVGSYAIRLILNPEAGELTVCWIYRQT